jgi:hypothetical protein
MTINATWHRRHPMPPNATLAQRVAWHVAHSRHCGCRDMPPSIVAELKRRGVTSPKRRSR